PFPTSSLATRLPGHRLTPASQAREEVFQLRELDLGLAFLGFRVLGEDVEDERGAIDDLHLHYGFEPAALGRSEFGVNDDGVGAGSGDEIGELPGLSRSQVRGRIGGVASLEHPVEHGRAGGLGKGCELVEGTLRRLGRAGGEDPGEDHPFEAELPVLHFVSTVSFAAVASPAPERGGSVESDLSASVLAFGLAVLQRGAPAHEDPRREFICAVMSVGRGHRVLTYRWYLHSSMPVPGWPVIFRSM